MFVIIKGVKLFEMYPLKFSVFCEMKILTRGYGAVFPVQML